MWRITCTGTRSRLHVDMFVWMCFYVSTHLYPCTDVVPMRYVGVFLIRQGLVLLNDSPRASVSFLF